MTLKLVLVFCLLSLALQMSGFECNVQGCVSCNGPNMCDVCQEDFVLQSLPGSGVATCLRTQCPQNCASCDSNNQCEACDQGFQLSSSGICDSQKHSNSVKAKIRILADSGNQISNGNFTNCTLPGCKVCGNSQTCSQCKPLYTKNSMGKCISCNIPNCLTCTLADICDTCNSTGSNFNVSPSGDGCFLCNTNQTLLNGCDKCNASNSCGLCKNGLQLYVPDAGAGICLKCSISNCRKCAVQATNSTLTICKTCAYGYSPSSAADICVACFFPCDICTTNPGPNNCLKCYTPMYYRNALANGSCVEKIVPGCDEADTTNSSKCTKCGAGYTLDSTDPDLIKCVWGCSQNCAACTNSSYCSQCAPGHYTELSGACAKCQTKGCRTCSDSGAKCSKCLKGFYLLENECKVCPGYCASCTSAQTCTELVIVQGFALIIIDGRTVMASCDTACATCSNLNPEVCLECLDGYFLNNRKCRKCSNGCKTCDLTDKSLCLSCYPYTFLQGTTCKSCNAKCLTCQSASAPDTCLSCADGSYLSGTDCVSGCPKNCQSCSSATICTRCLSGYTLFNDVDTGELFCAPCVSTCRTCARGQPSACLACGIGFYLAGSTCTACAENCAECTAAACVTCAEEFFMTSELTCAPSCTLPCSTCSASDPTKCTGCIAGYKFDDVAKACVEYISCAGSCKVCPMGYSLKAGTCLTCSTPKCMSCNVDNLTECFGCRPTYFLGDAGTCETCPAQCRTCLSATACKTCAAGYTRGANAISVGGGYQCVQCSSSCLTCLGGPRFCTSCASGFRFFGWKCGRRFRFGFRFKFMVKLSFFNRNYFSLISIITRAIRGTDTNAVTIGKVTSGSVDLEGSAAPTGAEGSSEAADQFKGLSDLIAGGSIAGMPVGESSLTVSEGSVGTVSSGSNVVGIVLGICIPIGVLLIVGVIVLCLYKKKAQKEMDEDKHDGYGSEKRFQNDSQDRFEKEV